MKIINYVFYTVLFYAFISLMLSEGVKANEWCWTKSMANDPSYVFNPRIGGINWGFCKPKTNKPKQVKYKIDLHTSSLPESGTNSQIILQFFGTRGMSHEKTLTNHVEAGSIRTFDLEFEDIGELNKLIIKIEGTQGYRCKEIKITAKNGPPIIFQSLKKLLPCSLNNSPFYCQEEILPQGQSSYEITLKTSGDPKSDTNSPILIGLIGEKGVSNYQMFSETGAEINSQITNTIKIIDVGNITGYQIKLAENGKWKGSFMLIKTIKTNQVKQFDLKDVVIENPGKDFYKFDIEKKFRPHKADEPHDPNSGTNAFSTGGFADVFDTCGGIFDEEKDQLPEDNDGLTELVQDNQQDIPPNAGTDAVLDTGISSDVNSNDPDGGYLDKKEKKEIIDLSCEQELVNSEPTMDTFGPNYPTSNIEYINVLARCPSNCHATQGQIYGLGIHPDISPICLSALADKAISEYGGVISISIFPGLEKYVIKEEDSKQFKLIRIASYFGKTKKSYTVSKVDNVDLVERDIRILDGKGKISNEGRLEIRINGKWGTICNKDNNPYSAKRICKDLGYNDGKWLGRDYERGFCKRFKGQNYCGSDNLKSFYNSLACDTSHNNFNSCTKKDANINDCPHELDSIISCTSTAYDGADLTPNGTIKLVKTIKTQDNIIGRLEAYNNGSYNPICKNGFSTESASVACKQMGYKGGDIIEPDPERKLTKAPNDNSPFTASEVICTGKEKKLFDCNLKLSEIHCTHDSDVVLKCDGNKGDPSGNSQIPGKNAIESHPALGKLNMIKLKVDCNFKGNSPKLRGDPGSVILINCPANCLNLKGSIKGLGLYSFDSNVCHAAIHSGVIHDEKGGSFAYTKVWGQKHYMGVQRNGILSTEFLDKMPFSFTITSINSSWNNMWIAFKENHAGIFLEKSTSVSLTNKSRLRSRQLKKNNNLENNLMSSFLQVKSRTSLRSRKYSATQGLPKPIFEWVEVNPSHTFSDKENGSIDIEEHNVASLTKYQFIIKASMSDFKNKKSYFFSYSGCSGFNIFLNEEDNLVFGDPCNETAQINTEIPFPINEKVIIWAYYDDITLKVAVFNEKSKKPISKVFHKALEINNASAIAIGKKSDGNDGFFFGYIDFVLLYPDEIPFSMIPNIINAINNKNKSPVPDNSRITFDERDCISPCENGPLPGEPGCSEAPKDANPYEDELESDMTKAAKPKEKPRMELNFSIQGVSQVFEQTRKAEQHLNQLVSNAKFGMKQLNDNLDAITNARNAYGTRDPSKKSSKAEQKFYNPTVELEPINPNLTEQYGTNDPKDQNNIESMIVDCTTNLRDKRFNGSMGRIFRVKCPSCQNVKRPVYGSFIYHPLSSICKAASHAGSLRDNKPGYIMVELTSGKKIFNGSIGHDGSISATFSASQISFKTRKGTSPTVINCTDSPNKEPFSNGNIGQKYVVICPKNCGVYKSEIYGSEVYTDTSSICISAIHAGVMNDLGGEIEFLIDGPQSFYKGTKSFGVLSKHQDSYIRSFKFVGVKSSIFYQFKDDYRGKIFDKYDNFVPAETLHVSNNFWRYEENYLEIAGARKKLGHIKHTGDIKSTIVNAYGSFLVLKNAQWSSGRIKSNFLFNNKKTFALCFKYADANNYYSLEFNPESSRRTLNLMEKKDGAIYILESQSMKLTVNTWYRVEIIMSHDNISIYMQNDAVREKKLYFKRVLDKIVRGTIAFATNGNDDLLINGVEIDDYVPHQNNKSNKNKRSWNNLLKHSNNKAKKLYCQKTYRHEREEIDSCLMPQRFCKLICDEYIPQIENILNFNCYRDCNEKIKSDSNELKVDKTFDPKLHDKVDFLPKGTTMFRPGIVIDRKYKIDDKGRKRLRYYVSYFDDKGVNSTEGIYMTDEKMFKCSAKLNNRPDC